MLKIDENWDATTKNYQKLWFEDVLTVLRRAVISKIQLPCKQLVIPGDLRNILGFNSRLKISSRGFGQIRKQNVFTCPGEIGTIHDMCAIFYQTVFSIWRCHPWFLDSTVQVMSACMLCALGCQSLSCPKLPSNWQSAEQLVRWKTKTDHFPSFLYWITGGSATTNHWSLKAWPSLTVVWKPWIGCGDLCSGLVQYGLTYTWWWLS